MNVNPEKVAALIREIAQEEIASRFGKLKAGEIRQKSGPNDLVTEVDEKTERALRKALSDICPAAHFVGEELAAANPKVGEGLNGEGAFWVVDPLDGTRNFVNSVEEFGTIVAFVENGEAKMGWIYAIPHKQMAIAVRGEGATWDGAQIAPQVPTGRPVALRSLGFLPPDRQTRLRARLADHFDSRPGYCSAYAYIALARGLVDLKISSRIHPWDHVAGVLIATEAGGKVAFLDDGERYAPQRTIDKPLLAAAPGRDWRAFAKDLGD